MGKPLVIFLLISAIVSVALAKESSDARALRRKYGRNWRNGYDLGFWDYNGFATNGFPPNGFAPPPFGGPQPQALPYYQPQQPGFNPQYQSFPNYFEPPKSQYPTSRNDFSYPFKQQPLDEQLLQAPFGSSPALNRPSEFPKPIDQTPANLNSFPSYRENSIYPNVHNQFNRQPPSPIQFNQQPSSAPRQSPLQSLQTPQTSQSLPSYYPVPITSPALHPWWLGDNVCVEKEETMDDWDKDGDFKAGFQSGHAINFESCLERYNKHICKTISNHEGRKKTKTVTRQCCHGYARSRKDGPNATCEKVVLLSFQETAEQFGTPDFLGIFKNNNFTDKFVTNSTLFVPLLQALGEHLGELNNRTTTTTTSTSSSPRDVSIIFDHYINNYIQVEYVENEQVFQTNNNHSVRFNVFPRPPSDDVFEYPHQYTANCIPIVKPNVFALTGVVLGIEREIVPVKNNVMELIRNRNDLSIFKQVLEKTNLTDFLENQDAITILAPNDKAFESLSPALGRALVQGNMCALDNLKNHILSLTFCSSAVVPNAKAHAINVLGQPLSFERNRKGRTINAGNWVTVNDKARFVESDVMGTNGVLHIIDNVLPTDSGLPILSLLEKRNSTLFSRLVHVAGLADDFERLINVTYFVPTDRAFEASGWAAALEKNPESLSNNETLRNILLYHVADHTIGSDALNNGLIRTRADDNLIVNVFNPNPLQSLPMSTTTINCARFVTTDDVGCNTVMHQVDKVFEPPKKTFLEILESTENYSNFYDLIKVANMTGVLNNPEEDRTLLIPTNDVFAEQQEFFHTLLLNRDSAETFVATHILTNGLCCAGIQSSTYPFIRTVQTLNGLTLAVNRLRRPLISNVGITKCDLMAKNGIVHEINDVVEYKKPGGGGTQFY